MVGDLVLLLVVSAHDPSRELGSSDGITSSGSGDLVPLVDGRRGGVLFAGMYSSSFGEFS
jgi:hypothetical protein